MKQASLSAVFSTVTMLVAVPGWAAEPGPRPVSPGAEAGFAAVATPCPTFSWTAADEAAGYELVVYAVAGEGPPGPPDLGAEPVLRAAPGRALSWTPAAETCLALSGSYAWSVRAVGGATAGDWSAALLFAVRPDPVLESLGAIVERVVGRYLERRGVRLEATGELAAVLAEELAAERARVAAPPGGDGSPTEAHRRRGRDLPSGRPVTRGVFSDDVELWLAESGSGSNDKVQLVFATPEFDGDPFDAWSIVVEAEDTSDPDDGTLFFSTPSFADPLQLFTDGSVVLGELRELTLRRLTSPPIACTTLQEGMFYWDDQANSLCVCDGSSWAPIDSDNLGSCS